MLWINLSIKNDYNKIVLLQTHSIGPPVIGTAFSVANAANAAMQKSRKLLKLSNSLLVIYTDKHCLNSIFIR